MGSTFQEQLKAQLGLRKLSEEQELLAEYVLGNIDDDGYLRREIEAIADDLAFSVGMEASYESIHEVLMIIQDFDPAGVGARSLQECLLLQINRKDLTDPVTSLAQKILKNHFDEFTNKHYEKIIQRLGIKEDELKEALDEILRLNPKPGGAMGESQGKSFQHIVPDFILEENESGLQLYLNSNNVPELKVSRTYTDMFENYTANKANASRDEKDAVTFVKQKLDSARWFIDAIRQRQNTMLLTMNAILEYHERLREFAVQLSSTAQRLLKETTALEQATQALGRGQIEPAPSGPGQIGSRAFCQKRVRINDHHLSRQPEKHLQYPDIGCRMTWEARL